VGDGSGLTFSNMLEQKGSDRVGATLGILELGPLQFKGKP